MRVATAEEIRALDQQAIEKIGIPGGVLMENAALRVLELIEAKFGVIRGLDVAVLCGKGNNGGDGFAVARHLANAGAQVDVFLTASPKEVKGDAETMRVAAMACGLTMRDLRGVAGAEVLRRRLEHCDLVVDAILGTGISGKVRGVARMAIEQLSGHRGRVVAVDIPSGLDSDTGAVCGCAVSADWTVTFALPKRGLLVYPGAKHCGEVWLGDIGCPASLCQRAPIRCSVTTPEWVSNCLPVRDAEAHKGSCGRVLLCAGSPKYAGAAILASRAAMRSGAGLVNVVLPISINAPVKAASVEATTLPVAETSEQSIAATAVNEVRDALGKVDAVAIGPGLTRNPDTLQFVREILPRVRCPVVLDADALYAFAGKPEALRELPAPRILTPHPGEMADLIGVTVSKVQSDRIGFAQEAASRSHSFVILKGARTIVASPDGETYINPTGNAGMASGGTGDVLTGMVAALLAQGLTPLRAAVAGVYLHGLAGDRVAGRKGQPGLVAGDLVETLPEAWKETESAHKHVIVNPRLRRII